MLKSTRKCMHIMSVISDGRGKPVSLSKISEVTEIPKPTCVHIIQSLIEDGYVEKISHTAGYVLGPSTYYLTRFGKYNQSYVAVCRPVLKWLARQTGFSTLLAVIQGRKKYIIDYVNSDMGYVFNRGNEDITTDDIYRTATGRIILAYMSDSEIEKIYSIYGLPTEYDQWPAVDSLESLKKALTKIKAQNFDRTEIHTEKNGILSFGYAMPIFEKYVCIGAIGISVRIPPEKLEEFNKNEAKLLAALQKATKEINRRLKFNT